MERLESRYHLTLHEDRIEGRFQTRIGEASGAVDLRVHAFHGLETRPAVYGAALFDALFPPGSELRKEYRKAEAHVLDSGAVNQGLRFRLCLDPALPDAVLDLDWELLYDFDRDEALARSLWIAFSRSAEPVPSRPAPALCRPRVLLAVADPPDLPAKGLASLEGTRVRRTLARAFRRPGVGLRLGHSCLGEPVTLVSLQEALRSGRSRVAHIVAHGLAPWTGQPGLVLQGADRLAQPVGEDVLVAAFADSPGLRLAVFASCHGAAAQSEKPFRGLPGRLLQRGIPAVLAMRREINLEAADLFAPTFYAILARTGEADVAANAARRALYLDPQTRRHWSDLALFLAEQPWRRSCRRLHIFLAVAVALTLFLALWRPECPPPRTEVLRKIEEARSFRALGGDNLETSFRLYREAFSELPPRTRTCRLDHDLAARAQTLAPDSPAEDAVEIYGRALDPLLSVQPPTIDPRRNEP